MSVGNKHWEIRHHASTLWIQKINIGRQVIMNPHCEGRKCIYPLEEHLQWRNDLFQFSCKTSYERSIESWAQVRFKNPIRPWDTLTGYINVPFLRCNKLWFKGIGFFSQMIWMSHQFYVERRWSLGNYFFWNSGREFVQWVWRCVWDQKTCLFWFYCCSIMWIFTKINFPSNE